MPWGARWDGQQNCPFPPSVVTSLLWGLPTYSAFFFFCAEHLLRAGEACDIRMDFFPASFPLQSYQNPIGFWIGGTIYKISQYHYLGFFLQGEILLCLNALPHRSQLKQRLHLACEPSLLCAL